MTLSIIDHDSTCFYYFDGPFKLVFVILWVKDMCALYEATWLIFIAKSAKFSRNIYYTWN